MKADLWRYRSAIPQGTSDSARGDSKLVLTAATSPGTPTARIGWVYRIEGYLDGQPVQYVGSTTDLKQRLTNQHRWAKLLQQDSTKIYAMEVFAELNVEASNKQTLMSARNEALRAAEQRAMDQMREQVEHMNLRRGAGEKEIKVLNDINASQDAAAWEARHNTGTYGRLHTSSEGG